MELYLETNPVFTTAESCVSLIASLGDTDAQAICDKLGIYLTQRGGMVDKEKEAFVLKIAPVLASLVENRYETSNNFIAAANMPNVVDLPCGFEPRGIHLARKHINYYGMDLPAVIERIGAAATEICEPENRQYIHYAAVDATNYDSMRRALDGVQGELLITTEGMLMYLSEGDTRAVYRNIAMLLSEFGGFWVTNDRFAKPHGAAGLRAALGDAGAAKVSQVMDTAGQISNVGMHTSSLFAKDEAEAIAVIEESGLEVKKVCFADYFADPKALANFPKEVTERFRENCRDVYFYVMTARKDLQKQSASTENAEMTFAMDGTAAKITLSGRVDSINAPQLLDAYRKFADEKKISEIAVDMSALDYISSAGLRTLLLLYKSVGGNFVLHGCTEVVREIMETTGFADAFSVD